MPKRRSRRPRSRNDRSQTSPLPVRKKIRIAPQWWTIGIPIAAIAGAILGSLFLSNISLLPFRILLGACLGSIGLTLLLLFSKEVITDLRAALNALLDTQPKGYCLYFVMLFVALIGVLVWLLIWHVLLL